MVLCVALTLSWGMMASACSKQKAPATETPATEQPAKETPATEPAVNNEEDGDTGDMEQPAPGESTGAGIANPVVESTPDEITDKLGVEFKAPDEYAEGAKYSMIGDKVAQMEYSIKGGSGTINVTYRISKTEVDDSLAISGDNNVYAKSEKATLGGGQEVLVRYGDSAGPGSCLWYNKNVVAGGVSGSLLMDPIDKKDQLTDAASFFVDQESKGF